jgi:hypothetical protein
MRGVVWPDQFRLRARAPVKCQATRLTTCGANQLLTGFIRHKTIHHQISHGPWEATTAHRSWSRHRPRIFK